MSLTALQGASLKLEAGQKVCIKGRTGRYVTNGDYCAARNILIYNSGKSSLILTLLNFLQYEGSITIDGIELSSIPRRRLRSVITTIPQKSITIPGSIRDNLLPTDIDKPDTDRKIDDATIYNTLDKLGLSTHVRSNGGLDTAMEAMNFSYGQKQLVNIGRAMLHHGEYKTKIVFMDEITSAMDRETEKQVVKVVRDAFQGCTRIVITHRPQLVKDANIVVEMAASRFVSVFEK